MPSSSPSAPLASPGTAMVVGAADIEKPLSPPAAGKSRDSEDLKFGFNDVRTQRRQLRGRQGITAAGVFHDESREMPEPRRKLIETPSAKREKEKCDQNMWHLIGPSAPCHAEDSSTQKHRNCREPPPERRSERYPQQNILNNSLPRGAEVRECNFKYERDPLTGKGSYRGQRIPMENYEIMADERASKIEKQRVENRMNRTMHIRESEEVRRNNYNILTGVSNDGRARNVGASGRRSPVDAPVEVRPSILQNAQGEKMRFMADTPTYQTRGVRNRR